LEIEDTQAAMRNLKEALRNAGVVVEDEPSDTIIIRNKNQRHQTRPRDGRIFIIALSIIMVISFGL
jgi:nitrogen regulatory protein PII